MPIPPVDIDGWHVEVTEVPHVVLKYKARTWWKADASDSVWGRQEAAGGMDPEQALLALAPKIGVDSQELLASFGL